MNFHPLLDLLNRKKSGKPWLALTVGVVTVLVARLLSVAWLSKFLYIFSWLVVPLALILPALRRCHQYLDHRGLDELRAFPYPDQRLVDTAVYFSLRSFLIQAWWSFPLLMLWWQELGGWSPLVAWSGQLLIAVVWSYESLCRRFGTDIASWQLLFGGCLFALAWLAPQALPAVLLLGLWASRARAGRKIGAASSAKARVGRAHLFSWPFANAIYYRQAAGWRRHGEVDYRVWFSLLWVTTLGAVSWLQLQREPSAVWGVLWSGLSVWLVWLTARGAYYAVDSMLQERESQSLEALLCTPLAARQWLDGWAGWSATVILKEWLVGAPLVVGLAALAGLSWARMLVAVALIGVAALVAIYLGLSVSVLMQQRWAANDRLGLELMGWLWLPGLAALLICFQGTASMVPLSLVLFAWLLKRFRAAALAGLMAAGPSDPGAAVESRLRHHLRVKAPKSFADDLMQRLDAEKGPELEDRLRFEAPPDAKSRLLARLKEEGLG